MNNYKRRTKTSLKWAGLYLSLLSASVWAFDSTSTGVDGVLSPTSDTTIVVPSSGVLQYESINIPDGVTVKFIDDIAVPGNPPVTILVRSDAVINGIVDIQGADGSTTAAPFILPPGGFAGANASALPLGRPGQGPGGGSGAFSSSASASGGSYASGNRSSLYGSTSLQPLLGGSGGGSIGRGSRVPFTFKPQGGSGAGAMLLAVSGTLTLNGSILVNGGQGAPIIPPTGFNVPSAGGGSGGGVRLIASLLNGVGNINVLGGAGGIGPFGAGGVGGNGRIRLEADVFEFTGTVNPDNNESFSIATAGQAIPASLPTVSITSVGGTSVPANPVGVNDIFLPSTTGNPVIVSFAATQVPPGSTIELSIVSFGIRGQASVTSTALTGSLENSTASVEVDLRPGQSALSASVNFVVTPSTAALYAPFADGEQVAQVTLQSALGGGPSTMRLLTKSGRVIDVPAVASL